MKCQTCGMPLMYVLTGNIIDWVKHPAGCQDAPKQPKVVKPTDSWEPASRHYRDIEAV